jgi:ketosteroid isomerase-like protein
MKESSATATMESEVREAVDSYYAALSAVFKGDLKPMEEMWSHGDDVTLMSPMNDLKTGWDEVRGILEQVAHALKDGQVKAANVSVRVIGDVAVALLREQGYNTTKDDRTIQVDLRATNVYRHERGRWKMIHHHVDALPELAKALMG